MRRLGRCVGKMAGVQAPASPLTRRQAAKRPTARTCYTRTRQTDALQPSIQVTRVPAGPAGSAPGRSCRHHAAHGRPKQPQPFADVNAQQVPHTIVDVGAVAPQLLYVRRQGGLWLLGPDYCHRLVAARHNRDSSPANSEHKTIGCRVMRDCAAASQLLASKQEVFAPSQTPAAQSVTASRLWGHGSRPPT